MRKLLFIYSTIIIYSCSNPTTTENNPELEAFISNFDETPLDEIKEEVNNNIKQFESFTKFFDGSFANKIEHIEKEDERYKPEFKIDTTDLNKALQQFDNVLFTQTFNDYESDLEFAFKNPEKRRPLELGKGISQTFIPKKIYYHDGEARTDSISNYEVSFDFDYNWGKAKPIDSIDIAYKVEYLENYDVVEVSVDNPTANYKGGEIKLVKAQDNYLYLTLSDTIPSTTEVQGYNKEGEILDTSGSSSNGVAPSETKDIFTEMLGYLKIVQEKLNDDDFKNTAEFQDYLRKNLNRLDFFNDQDGVFHKQYYYYGTINSVKLYFAKNTNDHEITFRAHNIKSFNNNELFEMNTEDGLAFINNKGETKIEIKGLEQGVSKIGGDFYEDNNYFYHLNKTNKSLDTLLVYNVKAFKNGLIGILPEQEYDDYTILTSNNKQISDKKYWDLIEVDTILFGIRNKQYYIINEKGEETLVPKITKIYGGLSNNRILISYNDKYGFIDTKGKTVLPAIYSNAKDFEQGVTAVKFNGTYKLIDTQGKVLVDTEEDDINFFDKDSDGLRIYKFDYGAKRYNYKGELMEP